MSKVLTGSRAQLKINGAVVAYVAGVQVQEENTLTPIDVLDQLEVAELAETAHTVSMTCTMFKIDGNAAIQLGYRPENLRAILSQPELTVEIYNSVDDRVEYTISGVKLESMSGSVDARGVWSGSWSFRGRIGQGM